MKRPLKFRAWNGEKMLEWDRLNSLKYVIDNPSIIVMQYTGIKDKKGKEIYEGDILLFTWNPFFDEPGGLFEYRLPVEYDDVWGCFVMKIYSSDGDLCKVAVGSPAENELHNEVIGNIYENPELLAK